LGRLRRQWFAKRKNVIALLRETIFQQESPLVDTDASNKAADADAALQELGSDQVAFGYLTATVTVLDADAAVADEKLRMVERVIQGGASSPSPKRSTPWMRGCRPFRATPTPTCASPSSRR
jgi:type IV secretion system protein VirB4